MKIEDIKTPVSAITGIGPQLTKTLSKINIFTVGELLQYYPKTYEDLTRQVFLSEYNLYKKVHTVAKVIKHEWFGFGNMRTLKIIIQDATQTAQLICFNRAFLEKVLMPGSIISVTGQFFEKYNSIQSSSFDAVKMDVSDDCNLAQLKPVNSGIIPIYSLTEGLTQKSLQKAIANALQQYALGIDNELPESVIKENGFLKKGEAIHLIHNPKTLEEAELARKTLAFEELYKFEYMICQRTFLHKGKIDTLEQKQLQYKKENKTDVSNFEESLSPLQKRLLEKLQFDLTPDQKKVILEIDEDIDKGFSERNRMLVQFERGIPLQLRPPYTMSRLLQGDVGSGKTLCALFACLRIISWKGQCAFMAPTEILARQHAENLDKLVNSLGIKTAFLTGNLKSSGRTQLLKALKNGEIDIVIGTHALFSAQVQYNDLQLVIIDEQHRFGVMQRQSIIAKGRVEEKCGITFEPHLLMMSATPIPQSLALTVFGDMDISTIKTLPDGRKKIITYLVKEGNEINAYEAVRKQLIKGRQAYFVYPAIDSDENIKSAERAFEKLSKSVFAEYNCALLHSKIDEEEQVRILHEFSAGKINLLAATTVIEVGVDVPNASCMVIENADRFGMAQLHQLRGRVGRGTEQSYCFLIYSSNLTKTGIERMKTLRESTDGFYIAEQDLKTRGPGELNGTIQAGALEFQIADLSIDIELLKTARLEAIKQISVSK